MSSRELPQLPLAGVEEAPVVAVEDHGALPCRVLVALPEWIRVLTTRPVNAQPVRTAKAEMVFSPDDGGSTAAFFRELRRSDAEGDSSA